MTETADLRPLVAHVVHRFAVGGLENGVVNLINHMPSEAYRHAVITLTEASDFRRRIERNDVEIIELRKGPGHLVRLYPRLYRLLRALKPTIVHSRNLAALEALVPAWLAGVPVRVHGEHGRDIGDLDGNNRRYQRVRRLYRPVVTHYVALSRELERYLTASIGVAEQRVTRICNGVDAQHFRPATGVRARITGAPFADPQLWVVGTVGRMQAVKDPLNLVNAFVRALTIAPALRTRLRLVMIGDGPLFGEASALLAAAGCADLAWLPGERNDVATLLRGFDCFVLPSRGEGISNTILEAMASGLPVIATAVGGNADLVDGGRTGELVAPEDPNALAEQLVTYTRNTAKARAAGAAGRARVERLFSLDTMVVQYQQLYDRLISRARLDGQSAREGSASNDAASMPSPRLPFPDR